MDNDNIVIVGKKIKNEYLGICSHSQNQTNILETYKKRWDMERLFRNMKMQGFNLEKTPRKDLNRVCKGMALVAMAILFSSIFGVFPHCSYKKTVRSPLYSLFTSGIRWLKTRLLEFDFSDVFIYLQQSEG